MDFRAHPHRVSADLGWRWWLAAAVDPTRLSAEETPRDHARIAIHIVPPPAIAR
jgi:hypothetical protein